MKTAIEMVTAFHRKVNAPVGDVRNPDVSKRKELRLSLISEELRELSDALDEDNAVEAADALADLAYVVIGAAIEWGIPLAEVFAEVHRSNMTKVAGNVRGDGKILKGPDYSPPNIASVLAAVAARQATEQRDGFSVQPGYERLAGVLQDALDQAQAGKGKERHAGDGEAFHNQQIVQLCEWMGTNHGDVFQASKKAIESTRLPYPRSRAELLGAINYLAAGVIVLDEIERRAEETRR